MGEERNNIVEVCSYPDVCKVNQREREGVTGRTCAPWRLLGRVRSVPCCSIKLGGLAHHLTN